MLSKKKILISSLVFMGLAHMIYLKEYIKGIFFAMIEIVTLVFLPKILFIIADMITLGEPQKDIAVRLRNHSIFMLIDGVIIFAVIMFVILIYYISVKSALASYEYYKVNGELQGQRASLKSIVGKSFPILGLAPTVGMVVFFVVVPLVFSALVSFTNYSAPDHIPPNNTVDWVGFQNYADMFGGDALWTSALGRVAIWTLTWAALATITCYFGGMLIAVLLNDNKIKIAPIFRGLFILPYAVPAVVSMLVWRNLLNGTFGTINRTLMELHIINEAIPWLSNEWFARFTTVSINLWAGFPYFMLMTMGAMTAISSDIYEAARIDGANKFQLFRTITLPQVLYQTMPLIIMSFTHNINNFGAIFFLTGGNPVMPDSTTTSAGGTDILITWIYDLTVNLMKYNYAAVLAVMIFIVLAPFAIYNFRQTKSYKEGEL